MYLAKCIVRRMKNSTTGATLHFTKVEGIMLLLLFCFDFFARGRSQVFLDGEYLHVSVSSLVRGGMFKQCLYATMPVRCSAFAGRAKRQNCWYKTAPSVIAIRQGQFVSFSQAAFRMRALRDALGHGSWGWTPTPPPGTPTRSLALSTRTTGDLALLWPPKSSYDINPPIKVTSAL